MRRIIFPGILFACGAGPMCNRHLFCHFLCFVRGSLHNQCGPALQGRHAPLVFASYFLHFSLSQISLCCTVPELVAKDHWSIISTSLSLAPSGCRLVLSAFPVGVLKSEEGETLSSCSCPLSHFRIITSNEFRLLNLSPDFLLFIVLSLNVLSPFYQTRRDAK